MKAKLVKENLGDILKPKLKEDIIKSLKALSQEEKNKKLFLAAYYGRLDVIKILIENSVDINTKDADGFTPLMYAAIKNQFNIIKYLIEMGADANIKNDYKSKALTYATDENIIELLKNYGAK